MDIDGLPRHPFSTIKRTFGEFVSATRFQIGKRDDDKDIFV